MILTEEQIKADNERWKGRDIKQELYYLSYAIPNRRSVTNDGLRFNAFVVRKALGMIENIQSEQQWIPVTERLPEKSTDVLICNSVGTIKIRSLESSYDGMWYWESSEGEYEGLSEAIAWMPLPKWKGDAE